MSIILAIIIFSFIIIFHELGHFLVAKKCDVKVNEFCLGLGPTLLHFTKGETTYSLKLLPFGGACMMEGEDEDSQDDRAFNHKPLWQRAAIVAAGPFFNFILAYVLSVILIGATAMMCRNLPVSWKAHRRRRGTCGWRYHSCAGRLPCSFLSGDQCLFLFSSGKDHGCDL